MPSTVIERNGSFGARSMIAGRVRWLGTYPTREEAEEAVARVHRGRILTRRKPPAEATTISYWEAVWQDVYAGQRNEETRLQNARMVGTFCRHHPRRTLDSVSVVEAQRHANLHPRSVRYLRMMWGKAVKAGLIDDNVWKRVEVPPVAKASRRPPTQEELDALIAAALDRYGEQWRDMLIFTAYTGLRLSEVAKVTFKDVDWDRRRLLVHGKRLPGMTDPRLRTVVVFEPAWTALERQHPREPLWRSPTRKPLAPRNVAGCFRRLIADTGLDGEVLTFHSLRHFHACWLLDRGASEIDVAIQLGHLSADGHANTLMVRKVYGRPSPGPALERLEALAA